jgi:glycosyltransferase involved in cell wall biosynthesis
VRLLFVSPNLDVGGIERQWSILIPALRARGHDVHLLTIDGRGPFFELLSAQGIASECLDVTRRTQAWRLIARLRRVDRPDVVVSRGTSGLVFGELLARRTGAHHVFAEHSGPDARGRMKVLRPDQRVLVRAVQPYVDRVIAVSDAQLEPLVRRGFNRLRIAVISNGISGTEFQPARSRDDVRQALGVDPDSVLVLFVAKLRREKRVDLFLAAIERARLETPRLHGVVVGDGPDFENVLRHSAASTVVTALGARQDIADLMEACDIVCLTSDMEAMPMAALEAMAAGRPVVATDVGGMSHLVRHGSTGLLVPAGSVEALAAALAQLGHDSRLRLVFGREGRQRQREAFSIETMTEAYEREFDAVVRSAQVRRRTPASPVVAR